MVTVKASQATEQIEINNFVLSLKVTEFSQHGFGLLEGLTKKISAGIGKVRQHGILIFRMYISMASALAIEPSPRPR